MAITAFSTILPSATTLPDGYNPPVLTPVTSVEDGQYSVDLPIALADAGDETITLASVLAAAKTDFETVQAIAKKIDTTQTVTANLTIRSLQRVNTANTILLEGVEVYRCDILFEYE